MTSQPKESFTIRYEKPKSLEEALDRRDQLGADIEQIQTQLGLRPNDTEWRKKAKIALLCKTEELRRIKTFIRTQYPQRNHVAELRADLDEALGYLLDTIEDRELDPVKVEALLSKHGYLLTDDDNTSSSRTPSDESSTLSSQGSDSG